MAGQIWGPCGRPPSAWALPCSLAVMPTHCRALCTQAWVTALGRQAFNSIQLMASEHPGGLECCMGSGWADWLCCLVVGGRPLWRPLSSSSLSVTFFGGPGKHFGHQATASLLPEELIKNSRGGENSWYL